MYSWLVTVLFLASAAYSSGGAQVPITSYVCTQPNKPGFNDLSQCNVSSYSGLRTCETEEGGSPTLLDDDSELANGLYGWTGSTNPFVVLDIPQGWWVGSVVMTFQENNPAVNLSVHSSERLSNNTDRTMFSIVSEAGSTPVMVNFTTLACGRYLRINMTEDQDFFLTEIVVFGTNDTTCTPPSSAGGNPVGPTTSVTSSNHSVTPTYTSYNSTTPGIPPNGDPVGPDSYVLPATISVVAVLLVVVLIAIFVVVICVIVRRHNPQKSLEMHRLSIHYRSTQRRKLSDVNFKDDHLFAESAEVPIHAANGAADEKSNDGEIRDAPRNYAALGPSESNNNVVQGAVEEPVAEGDISRPASQASIRSNEVSSKLTYGKVTWVHPSTLDHPYDSCNKEIAMAASGGGGHYETPPHWQPAEETYDLPPDCSTVGKHPAGEVVKFPPVNGGTAGGGVLGLLQESQDELSGWNQIGENIYDLPPDCKLPNEGAATDGRHKMLEDAKATTSSQMDKAHQPPPQAPSSALPSVDNTYEDTVVNAPKKRREPGPSSPTYASVNQPSISSMLTANQPPTCISPCKPSDSAPSVSVPQEDHIYSEVDMSRKKCASSGTSLPAGLTHSTDATHMYSEVDESSKVDGKSTGMDALDDDFWGGSGNAEEDAMAQPQSITSSITAKGDVPTQEVAIGDIYAQVDYSKKKKSKTGKRK